MATLFMKYPGIKGSATAESGDASANYATDKWMDLTSLSFSVERAVTQGAALSTNREASAPTISEFSVSKDMDLATAALFQASVVGKPVQVDIDLCAPQNDGKMLWWGRFNLMNCIIQNYTVKGDAEGTPSEDLQLRFTLVKFIFKVMDEKGAQNKQIAFQYDLAKNLLS